MVLGMHCCGGLSSGRGWGLLLLLVHCTAGGLSPSAWGGTVSLDGEWLFYPVPSDIRDASDIQFVERMSSVTLPKAKWEKIHVPGYWDQAPGAWPWTEPTYPGGPHPNHDGEAWYRLHFQVPPEAYPEGPGTGNLADLIGILRFEGVSAQASVWLNGTLIGKRIRGAFTPFEFEFPAASLDSATNVLTVRVFDKTAFYKREPGVETNATSQIPLGFDPTVGGIFRPVSLRVVPKERLLDIAITPNLQSLSADVMVSDEAVGTSSLELVIAECETGTRIYGPRTQPMKFDRSKYRGLTIAISNLALAKSWSPENPILYRLSAKLTGPSGSADSREIDFGFRSFTAGKGQFLLNGTPYFLFGAASPPHYENPSEDIAKAHLKALKEAGVRMVRFAHEPPSEMWLRLCDQIGLLAWIEGPLSADDGPYNLSNQAFVQQTTQELVHTARVLRNHPSAVIWSVGSGNYTAAVQTDEVTRLTTETALRAMTKALTSVVMGPSRVVIPDTNNMGHLGAAIEDWHTGLGWYEQRIADWRVFLQQWSAYRKGEESRTVPWVSSEAQCGYSSCGQGGVIQSPAEEAATRMRIGTPPEDNTALLEYQARQAKTLIEQARALRDPGKNRIAGIFPFTCANWFFNPMTPSAMTAKPVVEAVSKAYMPVIVVMNGVRNHYFSGEVLDASFTVANDDVAGGTITSSLLVCEILKPQGQEPTAAQCEIPQAGYYSSRSHPLALKIPEANGLETAEVRVRLVSGEQKIASNQKTIRVGAPSFCTVGAKDAAEGIAVYDTIGNLGRYLESRKVSIPAFNDLAQLTQLTGLVIGPDCYDHYVARAWPQIEQWIRSGGRLLVLPQHKHESRWSFSGPFPGNRMSDLPSGWPTGMDFVNLRMGNHPLFSGINREDLREWGRNGVVAFSVFAHSEDGPVEEGRISVLADVVPSSVNLTWSEVVYEVSLGEGKVLLSQLEMLEKANEDPVASLLLKNAIRWVGSGRRPVLAALPSTPTPFRAPLGTSSRGEITAKEAGTGANEPIRALPLQDAPYESRIYTDQAGTQFKGVRPTSSAKEVYYDIDDRFWFDQSGPAEIQVQVYCANNPSRIRLDYDSSDNLLGTGSATKRTSARPVLEVGVWKILVFSIPDARFANRQYGRCDFRLVLEQGDAVFGPIIVRRSK